MWPGRGDAIPKERDRHNLTIWYEAQYPWFGRQVITCLVQLYGNELEYWPLGRAYVPLHRQEGITSQHTSFRLRLCLRVCGALTALAYRSRDTTCGRRVGVVRRSSRRMSDLVGGRPRGRLGLGAQSLLCN